MFQDVRNNFDHLGNLWSILDVPRMIQTMEIHLTKSTARHMMATKRTHVANLDWD